MLGDHQKMREEKLARKEAEEQYEDMIKHLNDATTNRLKVQEAAQKLEQDVTDIKSLETQINKLRSIELPGLHHDLEKTLGAAREQAEELANFDTMSIRQSRTIEQERLEVMNAYEEELEYWDCRSPSSPSTSPRLVRCLSETPKSSRASFTMRRRCYLRRRARGDAQGRTEAD